MSIHFFVFFTPTYFTYSTIVTVFISRCNHCEPVAVIMPKKTFGNRFKNWNDEIQKYRGIRIKNCCRSRRSTKFSNNNDSTREKLIVVSIVRVAQIQSLVEEETRRNGSEPSRAELSRAVAPPLVGTDARMAARLLHDIPRIPSRPPSSPSASVSSFSSVVPPPPEFLSPSFASSYEPTPILPLSFSPSTERISPREAKGSKIGPRYE